MSGLDALLELTAALSLEGAPLTFPIPPASPSSLPEDAPVAPSPAACSDALSQQQARFAAWERANDSEPLPLALVASDEDAVPGVTRSRGGAPGEGGGDGGGNENGGGGGAGSGDMGGSGERAGDPSDGGGGGRAPRPVDLERIRRMLAGAAPPPDPAASLPEDEEQGYREAVEALLRSGTPI